MSFLNLETLIVTLYLVFFYLLGFALFHREVMIKTFVTKEIRESQQYAPHFKRLRILGMRFDAKYIAIILSIPFLIGSLFSFINTRPSVNAWFLSSYIFIISFTFISIIIGNYFYFKTYQNYYDIFMFGLKEDDTQAVLKNIYDDYPVIKVLFLCLILAYLPSIFSYYAIQNQYFSFSDNILILTLVYIITLLGIAFLARGTIRSLPLGKSHVQVSTLAILNKMVPNGIVAMEWAFKDRKREITFEPVDLKTGHTLMQIALQKDSLLDRIPQSDYLANTRPNVILALMESLAMNCLVLDDLIHNDLLGKLRPFYDNSFTFKRFLSSSCGTAPSLAYLYFNSPIQNISQSIAQKTPLAHTPFLVYKKQGYKTIFITSGNIMWRNLGNYLPLQGVDEIYDQNHIIDVFPEARKTLSYWGIADEFAFALAEKCLLENDEPVFINILTITNHPPYQVPNHYQTMPIQPHLLENRFGKNNEERSNMLSTFQYASNALGQFMQNITQSAVKNKTILAATGDHHVRSLSAKLPEQYFIAHAVPFILHIPDEIQQNLNITFDPKRIGSHKDIMPTLYSVSLSDIEYWNLGGQNLLAPSVNSYYNFAYNEHIWADNNGIICHSDNLTKYTWKDDMLVADEANLSTAEEANKINAYKKLLFWQINFQIKGSN
ncbi:LTA synthase family protein [Lonepinella sp. BR2930]|uniref:LTA synthase family protein n=1 Tax=Lonepinella sp. BR2930 TaxID=3434554 RepID=UPI003F6E3238